MEAESEGYVTWHPVLSGYHSGCGPGCWTAQGCVAFGRGGPCSEYGLEAEHVHPKCISGTESMKLVISEPRTLGSHCHRERRRVLATCSHVRSLPTPPALSRRVPVLRPMRVRGRPLQRARNPALAAFSSRASGGSGQMNEATLCSCQPVLCEHDWLYVTGCGLA